MIADLDVIATDGAALLDAVAAFIGRFVAFPPHGLTATTLWAAHAHLVDTGENTPRLALLSPEPGSGKTRVLEVLELLVPRPMFVLNASTAAVFRRMDASQPTLLFDEVDAIFTRRGKDESAEDLRAMLNAGHRKGARIPRCVGPTHDVKDFSVFGAVALAGLGDLPDTLMSRSVVIRMRRRAPDECVEPFRLRKHRPEGEKLRDRLVVWAAEVADSVTEAWPQMPEGVTDRPADVWEPLLAVAEAAAQGTEGVWARSARDACLALTTAAASTDSGSLSLRLLADLKAVFGDAVNVDAVATETLLARLHKIEESPWSDLRGKPLDPLGLARRLRAYGVRSTKVKIDGRALQGYRREDLHDAWKRYLPTAPPGKPELPEPPEPPSSQAVDQVPGSGEVPEPLLEVEPNTVPLTCTVPEVPLVPGSAGSGRADPGCDGCEAVPSKIIGAYRWCLTCAPAGRWEAAP